MHFIKMHGLGNDYVFVDCGHEHVADPAALARAVSDRHTGIGGDGLILIRPSTGADARMEVYNADGSRAEMCGNGIRCVAKYLVDHVGVAGPGLRIETDAGTRDVECGASSGCSSSVRVDMGEPLLDPRSLPCAITGDRVVEYSLHAADATWPVTCVSMGNPHTVVFVEELHRVDLVAVGPLIEHAPEFPGRTNVHFARVDSPDHVTVRTWERGSGATRACGTGACAVCVAGALTGRTQRRVTVELPGGNLEIDWADDNHVWMTGPAVEVFSGLWP